MPDRASRRLLALPSGFVPLMGCKDSIVVSARRKEADSWLDQFPEIGNGWLLTDIADTLLHARLHSALSIMSSSKIGGLWSNLKLAKKETALYSIEAAFDVAICNRDTAFEAGPSEILRLSDEYKRGLISIPPSLSRLREFEASTQRVDIVVLPPSPQMSNQLRLQLATPALVWRASLEPIRPRKLQ